MSLTASVIHFIPPMWITYGLRLYVSVHDTIDYFFAQGNKLYNFLFKPKTSILYFFNNSVLPQFSSNEILSSKDSYWTYNIDTNVFAYKNSTDKLKHIPYICCDLVTESSIETISEWIEKVQVQSPIDIEVPNHILVISWAYSMNKVLEPLENYTLNVITTEGEDKTLHIITDSKKA